MNRRCWCKNAVDVEEVVGGEADAVRSRDEGDVTGDSRRVAVREPNDLL